MGQVDWVDAAMQDPCEFALGALRDGGVRIGDNVAVFGLGAIGLATVQLAKASGAGKVFALDPIASRRAVAEKYGAIEIDAADLGLALREATDMRGVDVAIDFSGAWRALQTAFRGVAYGGNSSSPERAPTQIQTIRAGTSHESGRRFGPLSNAEI